MNKFKNFLFAAAIVAFGISMSSCSEDNGVINTTDSDAQLIASRDGDNSLGDRGNSKTRPNPANDNIPIRCFGLDDDQMAKYKTLTEEYHKTVRALHARFSEQITKTQAEQQRATATLRAQIARRQAEIDRLRRENASNNTGSGNNGELREKYVQITNQFEIDKNELNIAVRNGDITREEFRFELHNLTQEFNRAIQNLRKQSQVRDTNTELSPELKRLLEAQKADQEELRQISEKYNTYLASLKKELEAEIAKARREYFANFRSMLTERQQAMFDSWIATGKAC